MPPYTDKKTEAKIQLAKTKIYSAIKKKYKTENKEEENINKAIKRGIQSLKKKIFLKEIVCYPTNKSGRLSVNYANIERMVPHLGETEDINQKEYDKTEKLLNTHMYAWCNIFIYFQF